MSWVFKKESILMFPRVYFIMFCNLHWYFDSMVCIILRFLRVLLMLVLNTKITSPCRLYSWYFIFTRGSFLIKTTSYGLFASSSKHAHSMADTNNSNLPKYICITWIVCEFNLELMVKFRLVSHCICQTREFHLMARISRSKYMYVGS